MNDEKTVVENKVEAYNRLVMDMTKLKKELRNALKPLEGKKVRTVQDTKTKALEEVVKTVIDKYHEKYKKDKIFFSGYVTVSEYSLSLKCRTTYQRRDRGCEYINLNCLLGDIQASILNLEMVEDEFPYKKTSVKQVLKAEQDVENTKAKYNETVEKIRRRTERVAIISTPNKLY